MRNPWPTANRLSNLCKESMRAEKELTNPDRLLLMCQLSHDELCMSDVDEHLSIHQLKLSQ